MISYPVAIQDPMYDAQKPLTRYEQWWMKFIQDKRDLPFIHLLTAIHLTVIPGAIVLYSNLLSGMWWWVLALPYFYVSQFYFKGSFGLMLHCMCHRKTWKKQYRIIHKYILWILCPFFGHVGEGYNSHHIGMHHIAGNMPDDTSTTMPYQRDSVKDFIKYWLSFMAWGPYEAIMYFVKRKQPRFYNPFTASEILYYIFAIGMCFVNLKATMVVFIVPFFFARLVMMLGNWTQHSFVDPKEPGDELASTIICINTVYNKKCWNDGYHAFHHLRQAAHYTEYPVMFQKHLDQMADKKTFIFNGIHYLHIFTWLMMRKYDKLADHLVNINGTFTSREEAIALMKLRTQKFDL
jgi:Fatty acid desaturase